MAESAMMMLEQARLMKFLPEKSRVMNVKVDLVMIQTYGAKLHPVARDWGIRMVIVNQHMAEFLFANLGYAVRRQIPMSSFAQSLTSMDEYQRNMALKSMIDILWFKIYEASD